MEVITLRKPEEPEWVINEMKKILSRYGFVSKADLYQLVDLTHTYGDERRGWRNLDAVHVVRGDKLFNLKFPPEEDIPFEWTKRAIDRGAGIVPRVLTEQYLKSMKALGYDSVNLISDSENPDRNHGKVFCGRDECIVDSNIDGFYSVHDGDCPLNTIEYRPLKNTV